MSAPELVPDRPKDKGPTLWMIRNDSSAKRMRLLNGNLRTIIGIETLFTRKVDEIKIERVIDVDVLAPYTLRNPRLSLVILGVAIGMILGSQFTPYDSLVLAFMVITFSAVFFVVGGSKNQSQRIAQLRTSDKESYTIVYLCEDESEIRQLFGHANWIDRTDNQPAHNLRPEEERLLERIRYGMLLAVGSASIITLMMAISDGTGISDAITIPVNILFISVLIFTMIFSVISFYKMTRIQK